ncbi:hypothetical protein TRIATDRAFT_85889 [Trichoderma atroviride IMI 206040]|uniref:Uncharacterized protein n=1 Tax=Hypocrea atroviridis (strain ATCC 20476 / IMI 206040) TaxID=452589 RepID=G9P1A4_HYPAI|nr:uncharacterized protein TRIATDRAFT_85889 [Trichoderma atroviride IMI 206040]EHK43292.1 hypothetical protein TRIATDRAFT_85889 [Trichoderma atroviride IMI 206040]
MCSGREDFRHDGLDWIVIRVRASRPQRRRRVHTQSTESLPQCFDGGHGQRYGVALAMMVSPGCLTPRQSPRRGEARQRLQYPASFHRLSMAESLLQQSSAVIVEPGIETASSEQDSDARPPKMPKALDDNGQTHLLEHGGDKTVPDCTRRLSQIR